MTEARKEAKKKDSQVEDKEWNRKKTGSTTEGVKNPGNHVPIGQGFAAGDVIGSVRHGGRIQGEEAGFRNILPMNRLAQAPGRTEEGKKTERRAKRAISAIFLSRPRP